MSPTTQNTKWRPVGTARRVRDAIEIDIPNGFGKGLFYIAAEDVAGALDLEIVPLYSFRPASDGACYPQVAGHVRTSQSERMIVVQVDGRAVVQVPRFELIAHYTDRRETTIVTPPERMTPPTPTFTAAPAGVPA